jgi:pimeloyl-ACP methyl ester carboxylesterase/sterol desaturase/sphingolipid hydroxylase (fatty acid hydroxylase superfamily)
MPNPIEILLDPVSLTFSGIYALLMLWEGIFPARKLPYVRFWQAKGIASYVFFLLLSTYLPLAYADWLPTAALLNLSSMNVFAAALVGILVYELGIYFWHRLMHSKDLLWRVFHQMHHSAERLDTYGAFFFSPMDMIGFTVLGTLCISILVGMPPEAITIFLLVTNFFNVFQHANIKTPVWLGYIIQRPESHSIHHAKGVHAYNYSDLPVFDILFGTFKNPSGFAAETGFYEGASSKVKDMLSFKDVSKALLIVITLTSTAHAQEGLSEKSIRLSTGVIINYVESGKQGKTPVILLHGYTDSWRSFEKVIPKFSKEYYIVALTHRGHGDSSKPTAGYQVQDFANDVAAFISEKKLEKCIIVGHSLGGLIAQQVAISHPQHTQSIILVATDDCFADNPGVPEFINEVNKLSDPISYEFAASFQRSTIYKPVDSVQVEIFIHESLNVPSNVWRAIGNEIMKTDFSNELGKISVPTLILWGNRDAFCSWNDQGNLSTGIPKATLKVYKDIGHAIHWENGEQFVRDIELFVENLK